ncbi:DUF1330 domain-containing protein [Floccifex sp.]|uniref:DUF1330 domain-containing protein n=1 Tax=Floccifex sp. TaxID=2815810 RepID=UPI003F01060E
MHSSIQQEAYQDYIQKVKPIVERYHGRYLVRSNRIVSTKGIRKPKRIIVIEWNSKEKMKACFQSKEYQLIKGLRENNVESEAFIVEEENEFKCCSNQN